MSRNALEPGTARSAVNPATGTASARPSGRRSKSPVLPGARRSLPQLQQQRSRRPTPKPRCLTSNSFSSKFSSLLEYNLLSRPVVSPVSFSAPVLVAQKSKKPGTPAPCVLPAEAGSREPVTNTPRWQRQQTTWEKIQQKFGLSDNRYAEFEYLLYLDIEDPFIVNFVRYQLGLERPIIKGRLSAHAHFWRTLGTPDWLQTFIEAGLMIPFDSVPGPILLPNNKTATCPENIQWVRDTILDYEQWGFVEKVAFVPKCVLPLQVSVDPDGKRRLIHDESVLNDFVSKKKFKLDSWEVAFNYCHEAKWGIKYDMKKFYHSMDIRVEEQKYFGFSFIMEEGAEPTLFVFTVMTFGYTRAPYIAKEIFKPLIKKWRMLHICVLVFYDDGFSVSNCPTFLRKAALQIKCDLLRAGLIPGVDKCQWNPEPMIDWVGLRWDFCSGGLSIIPRRVTKFKEECVQLLELWPRVTFRQVARFNGRVNSMAPVLQGKTKLYTRMLQLIVNIRHFYNAYWEDDIFCDSNQNVLFEKARQELLFWYENFTTINFRPFKLPAPGSLGWVDASGIALGGLVCRLKADRPLPVRSVTADNLLLPSDGVAGLVALKNGAPWRVAEVSRDLAKEVVVRNKADLNPRDVEDKHFYHRMFTASEIATDSNERELIGAKELLLGSKKVIENSVFVLHLDNLNAATVLEQGSNKYRLQQYALLFDKLCREWGVELRPVWIPRDLNKLADRFSNFIDYDDYSASDLLFFKAETLSKLKCNYDRFANNQNSKTPLFNSASYCVGTSGVDAFNYDWKGYINWLFPPPRLVIKTVNHLKTCAGVGLLITPLWKNDPFFPHLHSQTIQPGLVNRWVVAGQNAFVQGSDKSSHFGPNFNAGVVVWHFDFNR